MSCIVDKIMRNATKKQNTHAMLFDFSSAFDTAQYNVLLWKLEKELFITGRFKDLLHSFLSHGSSAVKFMGTP